MRPSEQKGFTLIELLVAIAIGGLAAAAILGVFASQNQAFNAQEKVVDMQQNVRAGMGYMVREIRMAGYDPQDTDAISFFQGADVPSMSTISFSLDIAGGDTDGIDNDNDGNTDEGDEATMGDGDANDVNEEITYLLSDDDDGDGICDDDDGDGDPGCTLWRRSAAAAVPQPVAENIDAMVFAYAFDSDGNGDLDVDGGGNVIFAVVGADGNGAFGAANWFDIAGNDTGILANADDIRAVNIWLLARSVTGDQNILNNETYAMGPLNITPNDNVRRRLLNTALKCRNMGI